MTAKLLTPLCLGLGLALPLSASAQVYLGAGVGQSMIDDSTHGVAIDEEETTWDNGTPWKLFGGFKANKWLGIEAGWSALGRHRNALIDTETEGFMAAGVGYLPLHENFSLLGKVGGFWWDQDAKISGGPGYSDDGVDLVYGAGAQLNFDSLGVRVEWERYDLETTQVDAVTLNGIIELKL